MVEPEKHPSGLRLMKAIFKQLFNGFDLAQIGDLLTLPKASVIPVTENNLIFLQWLAWLLATFYIDLDISSHRYPLKILLLAFIHFQLIPQWHWKCL